MSSGVSISFGDVIHLCLDLLSVSVTVFSRYMGISGRWIYSDAIECCAMCLLLIWSSWPSMMTCGEILVLGISSEIGEELRTINRRISMIEGVVEVKRFQYWINRPGCLSGLIVIEAHRKANQKQLISTIESMCSNSFEELCIEVEQDPSLEWLD